ncbi:MAG: hypothetical protein V3V67_13810 [Myxococcota bacterium]
MAALVWRWSWAESPSYGMPAWTPPREILLRREGGRRAVAQEWVLVEDMDPGPLDDVIEYDGEIDGRPYHVYGG